MSSEPYDILSGSLPVKLADSLTPSKNISDEDSNPQPLISGENILGENLNPQPLVSGSNTPPPDQCLIYLYLITKPIFKYWKHLYEEKLILTEIIGSQLLIPVRGKELIGGVHKSGLN